MLRLARLRPLLRVRGRACVRLAGAALALTLAGCQSIVGDRVCTRELRAAFTPPEKMLAVGESFTATVALSSCGGAERLSDTFTWSATDSTIVMVDAQTGRVVALAPGQTHVMAKGERYGRVSGIPVTVQPAAD
jgi:hypothetical protein